MKLYLQFTDNEVTEPDDIAQGFVEIEFVKKDFLTLSEERLFQQYFMPAIFQLRQMIEKS